MGVSTPPPNFCPTPQRALAHFLPRYTALLSDPLASPQSYPSRTSCLYLILRSSLGLPIHHPSLSAALAYTSAYHRYTSCLCFRCTDTEALRQANPTLSPNHRLCTDHKDCLCRIHVDVPPRYQQYLSRAVLRVVPCMSCLCGVKTCLCPRASRIASKELPL